MTAEKSNFLLELYKKGTSEIGEIVNEADFAESDVEIEDMIETDNHYKHFDELTSQRQRFSCQKYRFLVKIVENVESW